MNNSVLLSKHNQLNAYKVVKSGSVKCCGLSTYFSQSQPSGLFFCFVCYLCVLTSVKSLSAGIFYCVLF